MHQQLHQNRTPAARTFALASVLAFGAACASSHPSTTSGAGGSTPGTGGITSGTGGTAPGTGGSSPGTGGAATATGGVIGTGGSAGEVGATGGAAGQGAAGAGGRNTGGAGAAGGAAATGAAGAAGCKYKLCEDFESSTVGSIPQGWTSFVGYNQTIGPTDQAVATDASHSGSKALKSIAASQGTARVQLALSALGATANKHWGRIFYKVQSPSAVDNGHVLHTTFVSLMGGTNENRIVDTVETQAAHTHQWLFNVPDDSCCVTSTYDWTFDDAWHCAEWYVDLSTKSYRFFSDSTEVTQLAFMHQTSTEIPASYDHIILGATYYQHDTLTGPFTMWIDDLAINDTQIGCQ